ncbi:TPA: hypothetical protein N0F65_000301 [Lagenidium giganteum]|uniref:Palmitoyltransferase n=1 Tax=Lagenidium giganteum TaxID=4803 RepID=A0AAV2Z9L3_9STRA|nr:TPA: hypothetical protein N0F65_000301 [Lagenidium giganteum]
MHEELAALEALRDSSAELVTYLNQINEKLTKLNDQNECEYMVREKSARILRQRVLTGCMFANLSVIERARQLGQHAKRALTHLPLPLPYYRLRAPKQMRVNGFQVPFSRDQVTSWVLQPFVISIFIAFVAKLLDRDKCLAILIPNGVLILILLTSWYICEKRNPAEPKKRSRFSCLPVPPKMTRYCTICCKNSPGLDHHCTWLNTCIGENNYEAFYCLVITATLQTALQVIIGVLMATLWFDEIKANLDEGWQRPILILLWIHNAIMLSLANSYMLLAGFHTYLLFIRMGTYDFILETGSDGLCVRMLKCRCLKAARKKMRRGSTEEAKRRSSKTTPAPSPPKVKQISSHAAVNPLADMPQHDSDHPRPASSARGDDNGEMRHVAAYLLCVLGGTEAPSAADIEKVITSFGGEADAAQIELLLKELEGKNIDEVIAAGQKKLATVSVGAASSGAAAAAGGAAAEAAPEEKEEEEEADLGGGMDMFGGGSDY